MSFVPLVLVALAILAVRSWWRFIEAAERRDVELLTDAEVWQDVGDAFLREQLH